MKISKIISAIVLLFIMINICPYEASAQVVTTAEGLKFDAEYYGINNPEIVELYGNTFDGLLRHYLEHGKEEGRLPYAGYVKGTSGSQDGNSADVPSECKVINNIASRIYVGDSRTYIMHNYIGDDGASWLGFPGTKYDTFSKEASTYIDGMPLSGKQIVILYGINDISAYGAQQTFNLYNHFLSGKAQDWIDKGAKVYFVNLVGVNGDLVVAEKRITPKEVSVINNEVAAFNVLMSGFPANIHRITINAGANPFMDGIHYNAETCKSIYQQINSQLKTD